MGLCCANIQQVFRAIQDQFNSESPFQGVQAQRIKTIIVKLEEFMKKQSSLNQNQRSKNYKIVTDINSNPKKNINKEDLYVENKSNSYNNQSLSQKIEPPTKHSQVIKPRQSTSNARQSKNLQRRSSQWSQSQYYSEMIEIGSPINKTYSMPRQVCELNEKLMQELQEAKQQYLQPFIQMRKINESQIIQQNQIISQLELNISQLKKQNQRLEKQLLQSKDCILALNKDIQSLRFSLQERSIKLMELQMQNQRLNQSNLVLSESSNTISVLKTQNQQLQQLRTRLTGQNNQYRQTIKQLQIKQNHISIILKYFGNSNLLPNYEDHENAVKIRSQILKMFQTSLNSTKLIYCYQPLSNLHFEEYIQKKENLFVLIKLQNDTYIGGFAGKADQNQLISNTFLFSLSLDREPIHLIAKQTIKRIDAENGFINFGNGQIRIKARSNTLSCNVSGLFIKYFDGERRVSIDSFLGNQERTQIAKGYEIYQLTFQENR